MLNNNRNLQYIIDQNKSYISDFKNSSLMNLIQNTVMDEHASRQRLLDCIQVFSNYFQKTVMLRAVLTDNYKFLRVSQEHLAEEFGHNVSLMHDRNDRQPPWDPILESCSAWFAWKMVTLDNYEKTLLVHLVLEESANIFFVKANEIMKKYNETDYFKIHSEVDEHHASMGIELLTDLTSIEYKNLAIVQHQGWDVLNTVCDRITKMTNK